MAVLVPPDGGSSTPGSSAPEPSRDDHSLFRAVLVGAGVVLACAAISLVLPSRRSPGAGLLGGWNGNSVGFLAVAAGFAAIGWRAASARSRTSLHIAAAACGATVGVTQLLGRSLAAYGSVAWFDSPTMIVRAVVVFVGHLALGHALALLVLGWVESGAPLPRFRVGDRWARWRAAAGRMRRQHPTRFFMTVTAVVCLSRVPYLVWLWPGNVTPDSLNQIQQVVGLAPLNNHHPVVHTLMIGIFLRPASMVGHLSWGVGAYSVAQIVVTSAAVAYAVTRMLAWGIRRWMVGATFLAFTLFPVAAAYSITMWKNVPFAAAVLTVVVMLVDLALNPSAVRRPAWFVGFGVCLLGVFFLRSDGPYEAALAALVAVFLVTARQRRQMVATAAAVLVTGVVVLGPVFDALEVVPDVPQSALSVPLQQIGRVCRDHAAELTPEQVAYVADVFQGATPQEVGEKYDPSISDAMKDRASADYLTDHKDDFVAGWLSLGLAYPSDYANSFLAGSYGYWYPEFQRHAVSLGVFDSPEVPGLSPHRPPAARTTVSAVLFNPRTVPVVSMAYSAGAGLYGFVLAAAAFAVTRRWRLVATMVPLAMVWLVDLASPVVGDYRYATGYLVALPVVLPVALGLLGPRPPQASPTGRLTS